jgi:6-phosphogluconolactonase
VLPINDDGTVGSAGTPDKGPNNGCTNAHQAAFDHSGDHLLVPCLGSNYVIQFKFNAGQLSYNDPATVAVAGGPRHVAFDAHEHYAYVISELESLITSFKYDAATGKLSDPQTINSYDKTKGKSAHILVHPSGHWLYASNRTESSIGWFSIDGSGRPRAAGFTSDQIATPRDFSIDASGAWLISANQDGDQNVLVFQIDPGDGHLSRKTAAATGGNPTFTQALVLTP